MSPPTRFRGTITNGNNNIGSSSLWRNIIIILALSVERRRRRGTIHGKGAVRMRGDIRSSSDNDMADRGEKCRVLRAPPLLSLISRSGGGGSGGGGNDSSGRRSGGSAVAWCRAAATAASADRLRRRGPERASDVRRVGYLARNTSGPRSECRGAIAVFTPNGTPTVHPTADRRSTP